MLIGNGRIRSGARKKTPLSLDKSSPPGPPRSPCYSLCHGTRQGLRRVATQRLSTPEAWGREGAVPPYTSLHATCQKQRTRAVQILFTERLMTYITFILLDSLQLFLVTPPCSSTDCPSTRIRIITSSTSRVLWIKRT